MPSFSLTSHADAPLEDIWKLLHDPSRFPEWMAGVETVEVGDPRTAGTPYTMWPEGYPDFPMAQRLQVTASGVTISCLVSDLVFRWTLSDGPGGGTTIGVEVELPESESHRLADQQRLVADSLTRIASLAERPTG
jgi:uncharacterized protein YndB with AHSA1/START domain